MLFFLNFQLRCWLIIRSWFGKQNLAVCFKSVEAPLWITTQIPIFIQVWIRDIWKLCWSLFGLILILRENHYTPSVDIMFPAFIRTPISLLVDDSLVWHKPSRKQNNYKLCNRQADFVMSWLVSGIVLQCECFLGARKISFQRDNLILFFSSTSQTWMKMLKEKN